MRARCLRLIDRYRHSGLAQRSAGCCRFTPTCSHYAEDVLRTRALPLALLLIIARVLRCRRPMRATTRRKGAAVLLLSGIVTMGTVGLAQAVTRPGMLRPDLTRGGCTGTINGLDVGGFNRNNPLVVTPGQQITAAGFAPQEFRNAAEPPSAITTDAISVEIVSGIVSADITNDVHKGLRSFESKVGVSNYLHNGSGLYRVTVRMTGLLGGRSVWSCGATFYARLDGSDAPGMIAGGLAILAPRWCRDVLRQDRLDGR